MHATLGRNRSARYCPINRADCQIGQVRPVAVVAMIRTRTMCLLLVDDDGDARESLAAFLRGEGHDVWLAADERAAQELVAAGVRPCFILSGLATRDGAHRFVDGLARAGRSDLPIVFWTSQLEEVPHGHVGIARSVGLPVLLATVAFYARCRPAR